MVDPAGRWSLRPLIRLTDREIVERDWEREKGDVLPVGKWDGTFLEHSYWFRPGRSAHQAVAKAQQYIAEGDRFVVDLDLEKF